MALGLAIASGIASIAQGAVSATNSLESARRARKEGRRQANVEAAIGDQQLEESRDQSRRLRAAQRAAFGAAGVEQGGTASLVSLDSVFQAIKERQRISQRAAQRSELARRTGTAQSRQLTGAAIGASIGAIGSALGSFGKAASIKGAKANSQAKVQQAFSEGREFEKAATSIPFISI